MPVRHMDISCSPAPTASQCQRIFSLLLQNVTDFSGYTADPIIGSYLTGGGTITVNAVGDNLPVNVIRELNPGTVNAVSTFQIGNIYHTVANRNTNWGCFLLPSLDSDTAYLPDLTGTISGSTGAYPTIADKVIRAINLGTNLTTSNEVGCGTMLNPIASNLGFLQPLTANWSLRVADSYIALGRVQVGGYRSSIYALHEGKLVHVVIQDTESPGSYQSVGAALCRDTAPLDNSVLNSSTLLTNYGPVINDMLNSTYLKGGSGTTPLPVNRKRVPPFILDSVSGLSKKPVFQFKVANTYDDAIYDVSGIHNVLFAAYESNSDYVTQLSNEGTTYKSVGHFLFAV